MVLRRRDHLGQFLDIPRIIFEIVVKSDNIANDRKEFSFGDSKPEERLASGLATGNQKITALYHFNAVPRQLLTTTVRWIIDKYRRLGDGRAPELFAYSQSDLPLF